MKSILERASKYIATIYSISGNGGHASAFTAAKALAVGFNLPEETCMELLREWNQTNAIPPWTEDQLRHKVREAAKSPRQAGYLLANDREAAYSTSYPSAVPMTPTVNEAARKASQRSQWPSFRLGTDNEMRTLATLRHVQPGIVWLAQREGLLRFTTAITGETCYVFTERTLAQVRRLDGHPFTKADGTTFKSRNLPGSEGKWMGSTMLESQPKAPVLIVEGLVAWMEAAHAITASDHLPWLPFAALAAGVKLESRELALLAGRRVLIARDLGEAGVEAALNWEESLQEIGVQVSIWEPPPGAKDLGDALRLPSFNANSIFNHA